MNNSQKYPVVMDNKIIDKNQRKRECSFEVPDCPKSD